MQLMLVMKAPGGGPHFPVIFSTCSGRKTYVRMADFYDLGDFRRKFDSTSDRVSSAIATLDISRRQAKAAELESRTSDPSFWEDDTASTVLKQLSEQRSVIEQSFGWQKALEEVGTALQLAGEEADAAGELLREAQCILDRLESELAGWERRNLMRGEYDSCGAVLSLVAGAGGVDAMDWTSMLLRMYQRWGERGGYEVSLTEQTEGEEAGLKSASLTFRGEFAYGQLRGEHGTHRLVRLSPFNSANKRQARCITPCDDLHARAAPTREV